MTPSSLARRALLDEHHRVLRRDVELLAARLAGDRVVDADHVVAQLRVQRAVALVGAGRQAILLDAHHPAHLVIVDALAARAGELVGPRFVLAVEEVAFVERHAPIIQFERTQIRVMATDPTRTYPSELPVLALRQTVVFPLTLQPLAINRPPSIEAVHRALAGDRLLFPRAAERPTRGARAAATCGRSARSPRSGRWPRCPNGGIHVIVEGHRLRAKADAVTQSGRVAARDGRRRCPKQTERTLEVDAYVRRLQELIDRALSVTSGLSQELRGLVAGIDDPLRLAYLLASLLDIKADEKQQILESRRL